MANIIRTPCDSVAASSPNPMGIPKSSEKWVLAATILGSSMAFIEATVVNIALPALQSALHASISQIQWVVEAYSLTLGALLIVGGALGDLYGRRFIFLCGVIVFGLTSVCCGAAQTITQLIFARTAQGIGAALLVPGSLALITASFPEERRGQAIGVWAGFTAITTAAGPLLGGWLVQHASWRWIFFLNVPFALVVFFITLFFVHKCKIENPNRHLDWLGALLATVGLGGIVFGLIEWEQHTFFSILAIIIGIFALVAFLFVERYSTAPMVPFSMFHSRNFTGANLITFFLYFSLNGVLFFFPLDLIQIQGYTATEAGAALLPFILLMFLLSRWAGGLIKRYGSRLPLIIGPAIAAVGFALFLRADMGNSYWTSFFPAVVVLGLGMAVSVAPLTTVVMNSVTMSHVGAASGINNAVSRIAGLLAVAILGLVMTTIFNQQLMHGLKNSSLPTTIQQEIFNQRSLLAAIKTNNLAAQHIIQDAFTFGYQMVIAIAVIFALISSFWAYVFLSGKNKKV